MLWYVHFFAPLKNFETNSYREYNSGSRYLLSFTDRNSATAGMGLKLAVPSESHAHITVVWECCKDDQQSLWEMMKFDPQLPLNPLSDRHQIWHAWLRHGYLSPRKNWAQSVKGFLLPIYAKYTPPCYFFWFFQSPTAETPAWILTLKTSNDAVVRKEVPFEGYKSEISYLTEF